MEQAAKAIHHLQNAEVTGERNDRQANSVANVRVSPGNIQQTESSTSSSSSRPRRGVLSKSTNSFTLAKLERDIEVLESGIALLNQEMMNPEQASNAAKLLELGMKRDELELQLTERMATYFDRLES